MARFVCHRPDGLEEERAQRHFLATVCHRPDGLEVRKKIYVLV